MAFLVHLQLSLFLLVFLSWSMGAAAAAAQPVPEEFMWKHRKHSHMPLYSKVNPTVLSKGYTQHLQVPADTGKREALAFLSGLAGWASRMNQAPLPRQEKIVPREERATSLRPSAREKAPCKNFFWKTFSSC